MKTRTANLARNCRLFTSMRDISPDKKSNQLYRTIVDNTRISRTHLTPEIALRLITPKCRLYHQPITKTTVLPFKDDPYWGFYWPGGQGITRYILDHPNLVRCKTVLDIGSGCGASAIGAALCHARAAVANDIDPVALAAVEMNSKLNNVQTYTNNTNLVGENNIDEDVILLGDVFYDLDFVEVLLPWLYELHRKNKTILIGDPGRHGLTKHRLKFMKKLATYDLNRISSNENNGFEQVHVFKFM